MKSRWGIRRRTRPAISALAGGLYRDTSLSPDDPGSKARGGHLRLRVQAEGEHRFVDTWVVNGIASYVFGQEAVLASERAC